MKIYNVYSKKSGRETKLPFGDKETAHHYLMLDIYETVGNGDGENGGEGSLWRCAREIYDTLESGGVYSYADCQWRLEVESVEDTKEKTYVFHASATVSTNVTVTALSEEDAEAKQDALIGETVENLSDALRSYGSSWEYDGNLNCEMRETME